jgi:hypothetical protein
VRFAAGLLTGVLLMMLLPAEVPVDTAMAEVPVDAVMAVEIGPWETPYADSMIDVDESERQGECLWHWMKAEGVEFTLESVLAAGYWTEALGGACYLIGEDDE